MNTTTQWRAGDRFMLRVAGLPLTAADALRCADTRRWAADVLTAEDGLRADAQWLSEALHRAVGATDPDPGGPDAAGRRALLRLRRQIHNGRPPRPPPGGRGPPPQVPAARRPGRQHRADHRDA
ncbi:hypothetical protein ACFXC2_38485, partial [Streptomyces lavendulae]